MATLLLAPGRNRKGKRGETLPCVALAGLDREADALDGIGGLGAGAALGAVPRPVADRRSVAVRTTVSGFGCKPRSSADGSCQGHHDQHVSHRNSLVPHGWRGLPAGRSNCPDTARRSIRAATILQNACPVQAVHDRGSYRECGGAHQEDFHGGNSLRSVEVHLDVRGFVEYRAPGRRESGLSGGM
jgi:hypothetical protein